MSDYIKFACECVGSGEVLGEFDGFSQLNACRRKLLQLRVIGVDATGIGFGNISVRSGATNEFYITGSATAGLPGLNPAHCAKIVSYDFKENWIQYEGSTVPSSESLTHAAVYESDANTGAVIHCHSRELWRALVREAPATSAAVEYGTTEMAHEIMRLFRSGATRTRSLVVMAGHEGGIITFGENLEEAFHVLMREWKVSIAKCPPL